MESTIYVITYHKFNHEGAGRSPLDPRFLNSDRNYIFYLIDKEVPSELKSKKILFEHQIDSALYEAGGRYFAEWSFLLAEEKHSFCQYPFFMISSRFYQKNTWLQGSLETEWEQLFSYLQNYGWGYLPSYDRPLKWVDLKNYAFSPFTFKTNELTEELFQVRFGAEYRYAADFFCNYIGFRSRQEFLRYINFYRPIFEILFDENYRPKRDLSEIALKTGNYRNEKPFTFYLEFLSHLFFFKEKIPFFGLHYNGYYHIEEHCKKMVLIKSVPVGIFLRLKRIYEHGWFCFKHSFLGRCLRKIKKFLQC